MTSPKETIPYVTRGVLDYLAGCYSAKQLRELQPRVRELSPESIPLDDRRDLLYAKTEIKRIVGLTAMNRYFQPAITLFVAWEGCGYLVNKQDLGEFVIISAGLGVLKGAISLLTRWYIKSTKKMNSLFLEDLRQEQNDEGEEWKRDTGHDLSDNL